MNTEAKTTSIAEPKITDAEYYPRQVAVIDATGIYIGMVEINSAEELTDNHLHEINECDLPAGQYRWNKDRKTFEPIPSVSAARKVTEAHTLYAIAQGFLSLQIAGHAFPEVTKNWLQWYNSAILGNPKLAAKVPVATPASNNK